MVRQLMPTWRLVAALALALTACGPMTAVSPTVTVKAERNPSAFPDLGRREIAVVTPLIVLILVLGFLPGPVLEVITPSVLATLNEVGLADPVGGLVP